MPKRRHIRCNVWAAGCWRLRCTGRWCRDSTTRCSVECPEVPSGRRSSDIRTLKRILKRACSTWWCQFDLQRIFIQQSKLFCRFYHSLFAVWSDCRNKSTAIAMLRARGYQKQNFQNRMPCFLSNNIIINTKLTELWKLADYSSLKHNYSDFRFDLVLNVTWRHCEKKFTLLTYYWLSVRSCSYNQGFNVMNEIYVSWPKRSSS